MVNYQNGKIYKIISPNLPNDCYIGSSTEKYLADRMSVHRAKFKRYLSGVSNHYFTSFKILEAGDAKIILVEKWPCDSKEELRAREQYWIDNVDLVCVNKLNAYTSEEDAKLRKKAYYENNKEYFKVLDKEYREKHKEKILERAKTYRENNKEKIAEYKRQYREKNKEKILEQGREYRLKKKLEKETQV